MFAFFSDPIIFVFNFTPLESNGVWISSQVMTAFIIIDIILVFFTGTEKEDFIIPDPAEVEEEIQ